MAGRKLDKSNTRVSLYGVRDVNLRSEGDAEGMTIEFLIRQTDDDLALDLLRPAVAHWGVDRHYELIRDLLKEPGALDRMAAERTAKKILAEG